MKRIMALGGLAACALAACTPPEVVARFDTETEYRGDSYAVECTQYFGAAAIGDQVPSNFASCYVEVDGKSTRCSTINQVTPETAFVGFSRDWRPDQDQIDAACANAIRAALAAQDDGDGGGYSPPAD